ncbi:hypothetical protein ACLKA7_012701 [Drosophila subpalustris]
MKRIVWGAAHDERSGSGSGMQFARKGCVWHTSWMRLRLRLRLILRLQDLAKDIDICFVCLAAAEISFPSLSSSHWASHLRLLTFLTAALKLAR